MKKYVAELIGSFFLVLVTVLVAHNGTGALAPLAMGGMLLVVTYASRDLSGAHFNPAVSTALLLQGKLTRFDFPYYVVAQLLGAVLAALLAAFLLRTEGGPAPEAAGHSVLPALLAEIFGTFAWVYVVLNAARRRNFEYDHAYGIALAGVVVSMTYALNGISGCAFNPAVAFGLAVSHLVAWEELWLYIVASLLAAAAAASILQALNRLPEQ